MARSSISIADDYYLLLSHTSERGEQLSAASRAVDAELEAMERELEAMESRRHERKMRNEARLKKVQEEEHRLAETKKQQQDAELMRRKRTQQDVQQRHEVAARYGGREIVRKLADMEVQRAPPPAVMLIFDGLHGQHLLRRTSPVGDPAWKMVWKTEDEKMVICSQQDPRGLRWLLECQGGPLSGRSFVLPFLHPYNTKSFANIDVNRFAEWYELPNECPRRELKVRAVGANELRQKQEAAEREVAAEQARDERKRVEEEAEAEKERHMEEVREQQRAREKKQEEQRLLERKKDYRLRLEAFDRRAKEREAGKVHLIEYSVGEGSKLASDSKRKQQEADEQVYTQKLEKRWSNCKDDEHLRKMLARLRAERIHGVACTSEYWEKLDACQQVSHPEFIQSYQKEQESQLLEAQHAIQEAMASKRQVQELENQQLMAAQPGARNVEAAAIRAAQRPLAQPMKGQRVIVKTDSLLGKTISGQRGTVANFDLVKQKWRVDLDNGHSVWQPKSVLYAMEDIVSSSHSWGDDDAFPPAEQPSDGDRGRSGKRQRTHGDAPRERTAQGSDGGVDDAAPTTKGGPLAAGSHIALPPITERAIRTGDDSDGYGSSLVSSSEDDEALEYARQVAHNSRGARRNRREQAKRSRPDTDTSSASPSSSAAATAAATSAAPACAATAATSSPASSAVASSAASSSSSCFSAPTVTQSIVKIEADDTPPVVGCMAAASHDGRKPKLEEEENSLPMPAADAAAEAGGTHGTRVTGRRRRARGGDASTEAADAAVASDLGGADKSVKISRREMLALTRPATSKHAKFEGVLSVGDVVKGRYKASEIGPVGTGWHRGKIVAVHDDDQTVAIKYDDGDFEARVKRQFVKAASS